MSAIIKAFDGYLPQIGSKVFLADNSVLVGHVELGEGVTIWYGAVVRGDLGFIRIGAYSTVQDLVCIHTKSGGYSAEIGEYASLGHSVVMHTAKVGNGAFVGNGAIIMDDAEIGEQALVAAGSLIARGTIIPPRVLVRGRPGKVVRDLTEEEMSLGRLEAERQFDLAQRA